MVWGAPPLVKGCKERISQSSWGAEEGTPKPCPPPGAQFPPPAALGGQEGMGRGKRRGKGNQGAAKEKRGSHASYIHSDLAWGPLPLLWEPSRPSPRPQALPLRHTQSSCPPPWGPSGSGGLPPTSLLFIRGPQPPALGGGAQAPRLRAPDPSATQAPTFECIWRRKMAAGVGGAGGGG